LRLSAQMRRSIAAAAGTQLLPGTRVPAVSEQLTFITSIVDRGGRRIRLYIRSRPGPGLVERRQMRAKGLRWCPRCLAWWWEQRLAEFDGMCAYGCGRRGVTKDHVFPVQLAGPTGPGNLVPACVSCNSSKNDRDPWPWIERGIQAFSEAWVSVLELGVAA